MSFRARLALLTSLAVAATAVAGAGAVYLVVRDRLHDDVTKQMRTRAAIHASRNYANITQLRPLSGRGTPEPPTLPRLIAADGSVVAARYPQLEYPITDEALDVAAGRRESSVTELQFGATRLQVLTLPARRGQALQLAQTLEPVDDTVHTLGVVLAGAAGAGMVIALLVGQMVASGALVPVRRLTRVARDVTSTGDLSRRIDARGRDELASLASSFNAMLERLEAMVETVERARRAQRQLVADASHELRTPLATLRANVELLGLGGESGRDDLVDDVVRELDGLTTLVAQLIDLAREDQREPEREPVDLRGLVEEAVARARSHYPNVVFETRLEPTTVLGSEEALRQAVANLLDNAGKWSPDGAAVDVELSDSALRVRDRGPGFADADLPHIFERFYRGAGGRTRPGSGLGLAIVAQVVGAHGGEVRAEHAPAGGALLTAAFPDA